MLVALLLCLASLLNTTELSGSHAHASSLTGSALFFSLPLHWTLVTVQCPLASLVFDSQLFHPVLVLSSVRPCSAFSQPIIIVLLLLLLLYYVYTTQHPPTHLSI